MRIIRLALFFVYMFFSLLTIELKGRRIDRLRKEGREEEERAGISEVESGWTPKVLAHYGIKLKPEGLERTPEGPVLFVANHQSYMDIFAFLTLLGSKPVGFVAKKELVRLPIFGRWILRVRSILLKRDDTRETLRVFAIAEEWMRHGFSMVIFPEGTRSKSDRVAPFKKGSLRLAIKTGCPVVPVTIGGSWRTFEEKGYVRSGEVRFCVHEPIETTGLSKEEITKLPEEVERIIASKLGEWNQEENKTA